MLDNYEIDGFGVIHQIAFTPIDYDREYLSYYEAKSDRTIKLGYMRWGWVLGVIGRMPESVLEIGYGTGTFIEAAQIGGVPDCAGNDIARYPLPAGVRFAEWDEAMNRAWDVVALFDVLEHIPDLSFLADIKARHLVIAVPWCRHRDLGDGWFSNWRMRLPDEHLHHFDPASLQALMAHHGFDCMAQNHFEDGMRLREGETGPNILSAFFRRRDPL